MLKELSYRREENEREWMAKKTISQFGLIIPCRKIWRIKLLTHTHSRLGEMSFNLARVKANDAASYLIHTVSTVQWDPRERTHWESTPRRGKLFCAPALGRQQGKWLARKPQDKTTKKTPTQCMFHIHIYIYISCTKLHSEPHGFNNRNKYWNNYTAIWAFLLTEKKPQLLTDSKCNAVVSISDYRGK